MSQLFLGSFVLQKLMKSVFGSLYTHEYQVNYAYENLDGQISQKCQNCQQAKVTKHTKDDIQPFKLPSMYTQDTKTLIIANK